jgi:hypothetical protein
MLRNKGLPDEYVMPLWWYPTRSEESVLVEPTSGDTSPAAMRVMYDVVGGSLPFAFMTELPSVVGASKVKGSEEDIFAGVLCGRQVGRFGTLRVIHMC